MLCEVRVGPLNQDKYLLKTVCCLCFDERDVMAKNKPKAEKIRLFLERWEGRDKAKDKVIVCH